jgi:hypothetical protein
MDLLGTPPVRLASEFRHRRRMMGAEQFHRLVAVAGDRQIRHTLDPAGADTGDRIQGV